MRSDRRTLLLLALLVPLLGGAAPQAARKEKAPAAKPAAPLVRKDLLVFGPGGIAPPRRDIFHPRGFASPVPPPRLPSGSPAQKRPGPAAKAQPVFALEIVYVGSVRSGGKIVALILRDGQTASVAEGDEIIPGYKVLRVTPEEIEVEGPESQRKTFPRQGERP